MIQNHSLQEVQHATDLGASMRYGAEIPTKLYRQRLQLGMTRLDRLSSWNCRQNKFDSDLTSIYPKIFYAMEVHAIPVNDVWHKIQSCKNLSN